MFIRKRTLPSGRIVWQTRTSTVVRGRRVEKAKQFATEREAKAWARSTGAAIEEKQVAGGGMTTDSFFTLWLDHIDREGRLAEKTRYEYRHHLGRLRPLIGAIKLGQLSPYHLDDALARLCGRGGRVLSRRTIYHVARIVGTCLKAARRWRFIPHSPLEDIERLSPGKKKARAPTEAQLRAYLAAARPTEFWPIVLTAIGTGMRRGELLGLSWAAVDLSRRTLEVRRVMWDAGARYGLRAAPKTTAGFRTIALPPIVVTALAALRNEQEADRLRYGPAYRRDLDLVFCRSGGEPWKPSWFSRCLRPLAQVAGLPEGVAPMHGLRHGHAHAQLRGGASLKVIGDHLGHANIATTSDLYLESDLELDRNAVVAVEDMLQNVLSTTVADLADTAADTAVLRTSKSLK
jgi:integrase